MQYHENYFKLCISKKIRSGDYIVPFVARSENYGELSSCLKTNLTINMKHISIIHAYLS